MLYTLKFIVPLMLIYLLSACASIPSDFEDPKVSVTSFKPVNSAGISPQFEVILHVTNPNREALTLEGMSYTIYLEGNEVLSGVSNDLPTIEPYDEAYVTLYATANLFGSFKLFTDLMDTRKENIDYEFKAKLDVGTFMPRIDVIKKGTL